VSRESKHLCVNLRLILERSIYFLPVAPGVSENHLPSQLIFNALVAEHQLEPLASWTLSHTLFRESNLEPNTPTSSSPGQLQVLALSHHGGNSYIAITRTNATKSSNETETSKTTIISVPTGSGNEEFTAMMMTRFTSSWSRRQTVQVSNGQAFEAGSFVIRFGDLRELRTGQGGTQQVRGTVVEIAVDDDFGEEAEPAIREAWSQLDVQGAKEYLQRSSNAEEFGNLQRWLEALRSRA
jgi:hypothetical protein